MRYFDLQRSLTSNSSFVNRITEIMSNVVLADSSNNIEATARHMRELLAACNYNPSLLVPFHFPDFSKGKPMSLWTRPHALAMMSFVVNGTMTVNASRQIGKCVSGDTEICVIENNSPERLIPISELFHFAKMQHERCA